MESFVYYDGRKIEFEIPRDWNILYGREIAPARPCPDILAEARRSLDHPIGSPGLEDLAGQASRVVILFDDLTRPTPAHFVFPEILNRLNRGGVQDSQVAEGFRKIAQMHGAFRTRHHRTHGSVKEHHQRINDQKANQDGDDAADDVFQSQQAFKVVDHIELSRMPHG